MGKKKILGWLYLFICLTVINVGKKRKKKRKKGKRRSQAVEADDSFFKANDDTNNINSGY